MKTTKIILKEDRSLDRTIDGLQGALMMNRYKFKKIRTSSTCVFETPKERIIVMPENKKLAGHGANFIGKVKRHFQSMPLPDLLDAGRPYYDYFRPISTYTEISDACEIDLNSAYWVSAYKLGYLPDKLYKEAYRPEISKKARLIALGVLGKKTVTSEFAPPYDFINPVETFERTRPFWDNIVFNLGEVVRGAVGRYKAHVYGVWFDAIFCSDHVSGNIRQYFKRRGYDVSKKALTRYAVEPRAGRLPGAKIIREFADGKIKEMDVSYLEKKGSFEDFLADVSGKNSIL